MKERPIKLAYEARLVEADYDGWDGPFYAQTASKARYEAFLAFDGCAENITEIRVRRKRSHDLFEPVHHPLIAELTEAQVQILAHANGNGSTNPGYRDYFHTRDDDENLLGLEDLDLMTPGKKAAFWADNHIHWWLTDEGKKAAMSLLPRRREAVEAKEGKTT